MLGYYRLAGEIICYSALSLLLAMVAGCQYLQSENFSDCTFDYTDEVKGEVVIPTLKKKMPELLPYFNVDSPAVVASKGKTKLIVSATNRVDGRHVMYENSFVFVFDSCSQQFIEAYEVIRN